MNKLPRLPPEKKNEILDEDEEEYVEDENDDENLDFGDEALAGEQLPYTERLNRLLFKNVASEKVHPSLKAVTDEVATTFYKNESKVIELSNKVKYTIMIFDLMSSMGYNESDAMRVVSLIISKDLIYAYGMKSYEGFIARLIRGAVLPSNVSKSETQRRWGWFSRKQEL